MTQQNVECRPIEIPVPFGTISGKWYGSSNIRPLLFIHGYSDNSGTFDRLIPLLPTQYSYLAVDLPGHGLSSRLPHGMMYHLTDTSLVILWIMKAYKWSKVSLVGHSLGAIMCYMFIGMNPEKVDLFIAIDALQPSYPGNILEQQAYYMQRAMEVDEASIRKDLPTVYPYEVLLEKIHDGPSSSIPRDICHHLLSRNITESRIFPSRYCFRHDNRTKYPIILEWSKETNVQTAQTAKFPTLVIKASDSIHYGDEEEFARLIEIMKRNHPNTKLVGVKGCHYVHLINPERVASAIIEFLDGFGYLEDATQSKL
ncbi:probable serine hydrolase isoform X2 [Topomyia yanbarensis]|uniref:probable serine hydrolase isoform X2 n=1 Tax=Topomyia yanbarensis TaxID=2498891 RepID=UPI00273B8503|nr:probable serine hydrolase isoform X2 [Topomyia yanbarensis]